MWYFIQVNVYSALLYGIYQLFLKDRSHYRWSRIFLIGTAAIPVAMPFIRFSSFPAISPATRLIQDINLPAVMLPDVVIRAGNTGPGWASLFTGIYLLLAILLLLRFAVQYWQMRRFIKQHLPVKRDGVYVLCDTNKGPGSWGRYIFLPGKNEDAVIYAHERAHIMFRHSADIMFMRFLSCVLWPDVMLRFITRELKMVHEFQADACAVQDRDSYTVTLLNTIMGTQQFSLSHTFFHHPLKRRINMLHKRSSSRIVAFLGSFFGLALITGIICLQSYPKKALAAQKVFTATQIAPADTAYSKAEIMPVFSGNMETFIAQNIKYPDYATAHKIQGRVIIKFIVAADGSIRQPQVLRSPDTSLSRAAIQTLMKMPRWIPGQDKGKIVPVYFVLPFNFELN